MFEFLSAVFQRAFSLLLDFLPWVIGGVFLSEILKYTSWADFVQKAIKKSPSLSIFIAAALGIASPLCTYSTVPIVIDLYKKETPVAPLVTFLGASSLLNPQLFLVTCGGFGLGFGLIRLVSVFVFAVLLGFSLILINKKIKIFDSGNVNSRIEESGNSCRKPKNIASFHFPEYLKGVWSTFRFIGKYLLIGILISVALEAVVPVTLLFEQATMEWLNIIFAAFLSIPVYICGGGVIPLVQMLMNNGMSLGAAMAFLIVGPATRVTALAALGSFMSKKMVFFYVAFLIGFSFILGIILNTIGI